MNKTNTSWSQLKFKDVARFINGRAFKPSEWKKKGLPIIRIQNLNDANKPFNYFDGEFEEKYLVRNDDILVSWSASLGVYAWNRGDAVLNQHIFKVVPNEKLLDRDYFFYCAQTKLDEMSTKVHGSTMKHITKEPFLNLEIPVPPLKNQKRIATILTRADKLKLKREQANQITSKILQAVFLQMFGDPLVNPKAWPIKAIRDIILDVQPGFAFGKFNLKDGVPHLRPFNILTSGTLSFDEIKYVPEEKVPPEYLLAPGDLIFNNTNSESLVGKTALFTSSIKCTISNHMTRIRFNANTAIPEYMWLWFNRLYRQGIFSRICKRWVNQAAVDTSQLKSLEIPIPPLSNQKQFALLVSKIEALKEQQGQSTHEISQLFNSLMSKAFNGELVHDVPEPERPQKNLPQSPTLTDYMKP